MFLQMNFKHLVNSYFITKIQFSCSDTRKYLGMPSLIGRHKKVVFNFLKTRVWQGIQSWHGRSISKGGREGDLIKAIAQAIPIYCMNAFLLPVSIANEIHHMINSFWWGVRRRMANVI